jgi:hypothetical protein
MTQSLSPLRAERWSAQRKAQVVSAVASGALSFEKARELYALSEEEWRAWQDSANARGGAGRRAGKQDRRRALRRPVEEPATAVLYGHFRHRCTITDIGAYGAKVQFKTARSLPGEFVLRCERSKRSSWVRTVWRKDRTVGVCFEAAPSMEPTAEPPSGEWLLGEA